MSEHFTRSEFACKCGCGFDTVDFELVEKLDRIRNYFNSPVDITSGCRCEAHNRVCGGSKGSQHLRGRAADIAVRGVSTSSVGDYAELLGFGGIGIYADFIHLDTRHGKARWSDQ